MVMNVNRCRKECESQPSDFDLLSGLFLKIGDYLGPVAIHIEKSGNNENQHDQEYRRDSHNDWSCPTADGHNNEIVLLRGNAGNHRSDRHPLSVLQGWSLNSSIVTKSATSSRLCPNHGLSGSNSKQLHPVRGAHTSL